MTRTWCAIAAARFPRYQPSAIALALLCAGSALGQSYTIQKLPFLPGGSSAGATDINDAGVVVGWSAKADGRVHAAKWAAGAAVDLDPQGWWESGEAVAINNNGLIATNQGAPTTCMPPGVQLFGGGAFPIWRRDYQALPSVVRAINSSGEAVGCAMGFAGEVVPLKWSSVLPGAIGATSGRVTDALDVNDAGVAVGYSAALVDGQPGPSVRAVSITGAHVAELPMPSGRTRAHARAINAAGAIVGDADNGANACSWLSIDAKAVRWSGGAVAELPMPAGAWLTSATDLNDRGEIVGLGMSTTWNFGPVLWRDGAAPRFLAELIPDLNGMESVQRIDAINNRGEMVGWGYAAETFAITPVVVSPCWGNFNGEGGTSVQDVFDYLGVYFSGATRADLDRSGAVELNDLFVFLASWFSGCP